MLRTLLTFAALICAACSTQLREVQLPAGPGGTVAQAPVSTVTSALPGDDDSVKFGVIGDTGTGGREQYDIALRLAESHARFPFEFVIMLGDNLYGSEAPSAYVSKFERPYKPLLDAGVLFYASLGNHDEPSQRFYKPFNMDGKRFYSYRKDDVEFFVLDSTYMTPEQLEWLRSSLERSGADWKIAYMHHPMYSSGEKHGSERDLQLLVEPMLLQHGVSVVFAGHEHFYERLQPQKGIYYITRAAPRSCAAGTFATTRS